MLFFKEKKIDIQLEENYIIWLTLVTSLRAFEGILELIKEKDMTTRWQYHTKTFLGDIGTGLHGESSSQHQTVQKGLKGHHLEGEQSKGILGREGPSRGLTYVSNVTWQQDRLSLSQKLLKEIVIWGLHGTGLTLPIASRFGLQFCWVCKAIRVLFG